MSSINKVILIGRLGQDPEVKSTPSGQSVATLSVATSETWRDKDSGQKQEKTEWHRVIAWGKLADLAKSYLSKGKLIYLEGKLQTRSWDDKTGVKRYTTEILANTIQFLSPSAGAGAGPNAGASYPSTPSFGNSQGQGQGHDDMFSPDFGQSSMPPAPPMGNFSAEELPF